MKLNSIRWTITLACGAIALVHGTWPDFKLDATYTVLLIIAVIPWLAPVIKSIELPGGFKIEVQDLKEAAAKVTASTPWPKTLTATNEAPLPSPPIEQADSVAIIREVASTDPNLAFVAFRIELERRLVLLAKQYQIETEHRGVGQLLRELQKREVIPASVASGLTELVALGNQAAHGAKISQGAALWMLEASPRILGVLDDFVSGQGTFRKTTDISQRQKNTKDSSQSVTISEK